MPRNLNELLKNLEAQSLYFEQFGNDLWRYEDNERWMDFDEYKDLIKKEYCYV